MSWGMLVCWWKFFQQINNYSCIHYLLTARGQNVGLHGHKVILQLNHSPSFPPCLFPSNTTCASTVLNWLKWGKPFAIAIIAYVIKPVFFFFVKLNSVLPRESLYRQCDGQRTKEVKKSSYRTGLPYRWWKEHRNVLRIAWGHITARRCRC